MTEQIITFENPDILPKILGDFDKNLEIIENEFNVTLVSRGPELKISGSSEDVKAASDVVGYLKKTAKLSENITEQNVTYAVSMVQSSRTDELMSFDGDCICITTKGKPVKPKTLGQKQYVDTINKNTITIGIGPAGTGKTFLAVAMAVTALRNKRINRIILTRPAVEAGEKLGFLPGDLQNKIDPYLRPLYDALYEMMGAESFNKNVEKGVIEVAPLAYMRGRTLDDSFIILDEAQNTTPEQMKMFLTRLGFNSKAIVNGDITQIDLPDGKSSGLREAVKILQDIDDIGIVTLSDKDVVRHTLVTKIIRAYAGYEEKKKAAMNMKYKRVKK
ncbi:MAG: phosphate starvation-inducible protein PhoH [Ruminococcaceae bacterium]|nr:phosphate starvation-inducible protein PhoH [Oscillospiraceae bacterium]